MKTIIGLDEKYDRKNKKRRAERRNENGLTKKTTRITRFKDKDTSVKRAKLKQ